MSISRPDCFLSMKGMSGMGHVLAGDFSVQCHRPSSGKRILQWVEPWRLAKTRASVEGRVPVRCLPRVAADLPAQGSDLRYTLRFALDRKGRCSIEMHIAVCLDICCASCLQPARHVVDSRVVLFVADGFCEPSASDRVREPISLHEGRVHVQQMVEDELLLSLPMVFVHAEGECQMDALLQCYKAQSA